MKPETGVRRGFGELFRWMRPRDIEDAAFDTALKAVMGALGTEGVEEALDGIKLGCGIEGVALGEHESVQMTVLEWRWRFLPRQVPSIDGKLQDHRRVWTRTSDGAREVIYHGYQPDHPQADAFYITKVPCDLGVRMAIQDGPAVPEAPSIRLVKDNTRPQPAATDTAKPATRNHWWECDPTEFQRTVAAGEQVANRLSIAAQAADWRHSPRIPLDLTSELPRELWIDLLLQRMRPEEGERKNDIRAELKRAKSVVLSASPHYRRRGPIEVSCWLERNGAQKQVGWFRSTDVVASWTETVDKAAKSHRVYLRWLASNSSVSR